MGKLCIFSLSLLFSVLILPVQVSAHATVNPDQVDASKLHTFTLTVPNERNQNTVSVRLVLPSGLTFVGPHDKPGWKIDMKTEGSGSDISINEITWSNGKIEPDETEEFLYSAHVPSGTATLNWKIYQTFDDGTTISWDQAPQVDTIRDEHKVNGRIDSGPWSQTKVLSVQPGMAGDAAGKTEGKKWMIPVGASAVLLTAYLLLRKRSKNG